MCCKVDGKSSLRKIDYEDTSNRVLFLLKHIFFKFSNYPIQPHSDQTKNHNGHQHPVKLKEVTIQKDIS